LQIFLSFFVLLTKLSHQVLRKLSHHEEHYPIYHLCRVQDKRHHPNHNLRRPLKRKNSVGQIKNLEKEDLNIKTTGMKKEKVMILIQNVTLREKKEFL
jgi:hypothetical protein